MQTIKILLINTRLLTIEQKTSTGYLHWNLGLSVDHQPNVT